MTQHVPSTSTEPAPLLRLQQVHKSFGGVRALRGVDFELRAGEIHALLGENGAGKSTLIKVLGGIHRPEAGAILLEGKPVEVGGVADANRLGIRIIHQELSLAPNLSVAENLFLGREPGRFGLVNRRQMDEEAGRLVESLGLGEIRDVHVRVRDLSVAHRQLVEIARALTVQARILVLDEPTSALSQTEAEALFATLRRLRDQGVAILYISHRLEEIARLADRITVLRDGESIGTQDAVHLDQAELVRWMVGREIAEHFRRPASTPGDLVLEVRGLRNASIHDVSFAVHAGEILGFAGLVGSGRSDVARALFGIDRREAGEIRVGGRTVAVRSPSDALAAGIVLVPEDRQLEGLVMTRSTSFNVALPWLREWIIFGVPRPARRRALVERVVERFAIKVADPDLPVDHLSGGNQQKVLVGRWLEHLPRVLVLDEPTRGVDVGAREEIYSRIAGLVEAGLAVILISSDLAEVLGLSHRVVLYRDGGIVGEGDAAGFTPEQVMERLAGAAAPCER